MAARLYTAMMYRDGVPVLDLPVIDVDIKHGAPNSWGYCSLRARETMPFNYYCKDDLVVVTRYPADITDPVRGTIRLPGRVELAGHIRKREEGSMEGVDVVQLGIPDLKYLLAGPSIDYQAGESQTLKTAAADNMLKAVVRENAGSSAPAARQFPSIFTVAGDTSKGPSITMEFAHQNMLETLRRICSESAARGTDLFFDVVYQGPSSYQFQTFTGQPGADVSDRLLFADVFGNIDDAWTEESYMDEITVAIAWGAGDPPNQERKSATATSRLAETAWSRREVGFNAGNLSSGALQAAADQRAYDGRPRLSFKCDLLDNSPSAIYGWHWWNGCRVKVASRGRQYSGIVRNVRLKYTVKDMFANIDDPALATERLSARFEYDAPLEQAGGGMSPS